MTFTVECEWDEDAGVWYVSESNVPGLVAEAETQEALTALVRERVPELVRLNMSQLMNSSEREVPMELLYKHHANIRLPC
jgi:hypothetical protein